MVKNPKIRATLIILCVVLWCLMFIPKVSDASDNPNQEKLSGSDWYISGVRGERNEGFWKCDATQDTVYFCYFTGSYIDAYNMQGEYQYTITLHYSSRNGGTSIYCTDNLLYAKSRDSDVFVFDGTNMQKKITYDEARELGCHFLNLESAVYVSKDGVYRILEDGEHEFLFSLPEEVTKTMSYFDYGDRLTKNRIYAVVTLIPFLLAGAFVIGRNRKDNSSKLDKL